MEQDLRHESESALVKARSDLQEDQQRARKVEAWRAASEARAAELGKTLAKVREQGREAAKINSSMLQEFGLTDGECIFASSTGQAEEQQSEEALQGLLLHERMRVSQLERKQEIMTPMLEKLRLKKANLKKQVNTAAMHTSCFLFPFVLSIAFLPHRADSSY